MYHRFVSFLLLRWIGSVKRKAGTEVWFGREPKDLPYRKLASLDAEIFASYTGPDDGLCLVHNLQTDVKSKSGTSTFQKPYSSAALTCQATSSMT